MGRILALGYTPSSDPQRELCFVNHHRLLRFAVVMWAAPLVAAIFFLLGFLFLHAPFFAASGVVLLGVGGFCLTAGLVAVVMILSTRNTAGTKSTPRFRKQRVFTVMGLLLLNIPVALLFTWIGASQLESTALEAVASPSGRYLAETVHLDEHGTPPYGVGVTLRLKPGYFWNYPRTVVFGSHCPEPVAIWESDSRLTITCANTRGVALKTAHFREVEIRYVLNTAKPRPKPRASR
ncbi:MAG: hypothetical protein OEV31_00850 [Gammaproteobacteria bacterium]|nr:hypothetical protein [Gammaproteobacteria bacterium]